MPMFFIHVRNSEFRSCDEGAKYDHPEAALASGVRSAVALVAEEINQGKRSAAAEISIERDDGTQALCSVVAISVSPMILAKQGPEPAAA